MIQETSLLAYMDIKVSLIGKRQAQIYDTLRLLKQPSSAMEIAQSLNWSINRVTPRILELRQTGKVSIYGRRSCNITGKLVNIYSIT